jgi:hypothetical protein
LLEKRIKSQGIVQTNHIQQTSFHKFLKIKAGIVLSMHHSTAKK